MCTQNSVQYPAQNSTQPTQQNPIHNQRGQGLIEYLLIVCLVAVGAMAVLRGLGQTVAANFATITNQLQGKPGKAPTVRVDASAYRKKDMSDFFRGATNASSKKQN